MLLAFSVITLHEISHAVVAEAYGLRVLRIELWPFGGMAQIDGLEGQDPDIEAMVTVVGPLQNFFLAALATMAQSWIPVDPAMVREFITLNLGIGALNLLPAAPLDGGHLAEIYLSRKMGRVAAEATVRRWGLWLSRSVIALGLLQIGFGRPALVWVVFGGFLYWGARRHGSKAMYWIVRDLTLRPTRFLRRPIWPLEDFAVRDTATLGQVLRMMRPLKYHRVAVLDANLHRLGILYEEDLLGALNEKGADIPVGRLINRVD